ncbi:MAG: RHS repeat-associated core domain-containing protein, partial [Spirochaetota bacterium]
KEGGAVLRLGGLRCDSKMEECRISNAVRSTFGGSQAAKETVLRSVFWKGWQVVEERERTAEVGRPLGEEKVARQFTDGGGIDEHLSMDVFAQDGASVEKAYWFHQNHRGDTIALTDETGSVVKRYAYATYGQAFEVDDNGSLAPVEDYFCSYLFQGRELDEETGLYYFRYRYYDLQQGRWVQRDPMEYQDSMGLYEAFGNSPYTFGDSFGLERFLSTAELERWGKECAKERCDDWIKKEPDPATWAGSLPPCPCKLDVTPGFWGNREGYYFSSPDPLVWTKPSWHILMWIYHPEADHEIRSYPKKGRKEGQQCCYDSHDELITEGPSAGTADRVSPEYDIWKHKETDVDPYTDCIKGYGQEKGLEKYHEKRPPNKGINCKPNRK